MLPEQTYLAKVRRGERPSPDEADAYLRAWHVRHPASTSTWTPRAREARTGRSSYEILAACIPAGSDARVLDLACGEGELSSVVHARLGAGGTIVGIDMSESDITIARGRGLARAAFRAERAQALSARDGTFDFVVCHYALMLINPLAPAVAEIARVLETGGTFAAVVPSRWSASSFSPAFAALLDDVRNAELPGFALGLGDPDLAAHGVAHFVTEAAGFAQPLRTTRATMENPSPPEIIWAGLQNLYWFDLLREDAQRRLEREGMPLLLAARESDGLVHFRQEIVLYEARRSGA